jgi:phenylacetate-CoA ligase
MNYFLKTLKLKGYDINNALEQLKVVQGYSVDQFSNWQLTKCWEQFDFFRSKNEFYKKHVGAQKISQWHEIPVIRKKNFIDNQFRLLSDGFTLSNIYQNNTSGSTGQPLTFFKDKFAHSMTWALIIDRYRWHGISYGEDLQGRFYGIPLNGIGYLKEKLKDILASRVRFPVFNLSASVLDRYTIEISRRPFVYLNGYTSALVCYAEYLLKRKLVLKEICPSLLACFPTSEMLNNMERKLIESAFGIRVVNEYGCAEMDVLGFEDSNSNFIFSDENVFVEILDENDMPVQPGFNGRVIVTSLYNKAMPFIRYDLGDVIALSQNRQGVNQSILELHGRSSDFAYLPDGRHVPSLTFYYITKALIKEDFGVEQMIIRQLNYFTFCLEYVSAKELSIEIRRKIEIEMERYLMPGLVMLYNRKDYFDRLPSGKQRQFYNEINLKTDSQKNHFN